MARIVVDERLKAAEAELVKPTGSLNSSLVLQSVQRLEDVWTMLGGESPMEQSFDEVGTLRKRLDEVHRLVRSRMLDSMNEAVEAKQSKKQKALLQYCKQFDDACSKLAGSDSSGELASSLVVELRASAME